ncbi:MAG TPA: type III-B CRISPR-associated protein Cas10/Cmr2, partial [Nannocystis sp.]
MAPTPDPQALWSHKARALLLPTPLEVIDPEGESQRQVELLALLEESGFSLPDWNIEDPLHQNAYKDAYFAHAPLSSQPTSTLPPLRHPLSGETIGSTPSRNELLTRHWPTLLTRLREILHAPGDHKARYRALWCALMDPKEFPWLAELPHHPTYCDHAVMAHRSAAAAFVGARLGGDEAALLQFHVGPVQSFIAAARRTGDLWLGSYIVAYLSMQAVHAIADELGPDAILYPDLSTLPLYRAVANFGERDLDGWLRAALPNRFAAIVPRSRGEDLAQTAAKAVAECWRDMGHAVRSKIQQLIEKNVELANSKHWSEFSTQLSGHLEMDARIRTWPAEPPSGRPPDEKYVYTFRQVRDELTAQRRMLTRLQRRGTSAPKCTQCGDREQLGAGSEHDVQQFWRDLRKDIDQSFQNLRKDIDQSFQNPNNSGTDGGDRETLDLRDGEGLCAVCLTKRFANRWYFGNAALPDKERPPLQLDWCKANDDRPRLRFPSVATIASAPFRKALHVTNRRDANGWKKALDNAHKLLKFTPPGNLLPGLGDIGRTQDIVLDTEGTWFYETSYDPQTALRDHDAALDAAEQAQLVEDLQLPLAEGLKCLQAARKDIY